MSKTALRSFVAALFALLLGWAASAVAQTPEPNPPYPSHLPYSFGNFVWWSDEELRDLLKKRIPGLGGEISTTSASIGRMREALTALLKEKGIDADVLSEEPSVELFIKRAVGLGGCGSVHSVQHSAS
jgi:hypothetical protein